MKQAATRIRAIDLFCGAGGSSWGAREAGVEIVAAFDRCPLAGEVHAANFPESHFVLGHLEDHDVAALAKEFGPINVILASPECTNHSPAKGGKPRCEQSRETAFQVVRFAEAFKPRWLVIENVVNMRNWARYADLKNALEDLGYQLREQVLNAAEFGVPQSRQRLFLLADREGTPPEVKPPRKAIAGVRGFLELNGRYRWAPLRKPNRARATIERAERGFAALGRKEPFLLVYYGTDGGGGWQKLDRPLRTITTVDRFAIVKPDPQHRHVMRMLQLPELQAAMGMPTRMRFESGTRRDRIKMIGNAVCPPVMRGVIRTLLTSR
ncbi:MAG: DNA cytosine methyltransferase [Verrucomicrobiales bacterium]|nr:DNA cytosine methyltransferase [Verrucomicrobiales bacterium]MCP5526662.1 DNA cytosine methyltransferase [Verrucomicrobiales bacterium]